LLLFTPQLPTRGKIIVPFYSAKSKGRQGKTAPWIDFSQFVQRDRDAGQQFAANAHAAKFLPPGIEKRRTILHGAALFFAYCAAMGRNVS
jgi:hypothetical protein